MRTVIENTESLKTRFDMGMTPLFSIEKNRNYNKRSCFYEFGENHNDLIAQMWDDEDDSIADDINIFFASN